MKKIDKLILSSFLGPFILTFVVVVFILLTQHMLKYFDDIVGKDLGLDVLAQLLFYFAVFMTPIAIPLAVLLSALMTFGNLGEHFELTAIKSAGISLLRALFPIFIFVLGLTVLAFYSNNYFVPKAALEAYSLLYDIKQKKPALDLKQGAFYNGIPDFSIKVDKKGDDGMSIEGIVIYDHRGISGNKKITMADSGAMYTVNNDRYLKMELFDGNFYFEDYSETAKNSRAKETMSRSSFTRSEYVLDLSSFGLDRTDKSLFQGNRIMRNLSQLNDDVDSVNDDILDNKVKMFNEPYYSFFYHLKNDSIITPQYLVDHKEYKDSLEVIRRKKREEAAKRKEEEESKKKVKKNGKKTKRSLATKATPIDPGIDRTLKKNNAEKIVSKSKTKKNEGNQKREDREVSVQKAPEKLTPKLNTIKKSTLKPVIKDTSLIARSKESTVKSNPIKQKRVARGKSNKVNVNKAPQKSNLVKTQVPVRTAPIKPYRPRYIYDTLNQNEIIDYVEHNEAKEINVLQTALNNVRQVKGKIQSHNTLVDRLYYERNIFDVQFHKILANSLACVIMFLIGAPLGAIIKKGGLGIPVLLSIIFFIIFYVITMTGEKWAKQNYIEPLWGIWSANLILLPIGLFFLRQARNDVRLFEADFYNVIIDRVRNWFGKKISDQK